MRSYLIEVYLPRADARAAGTTASRAQAAVEELAGEGVELRYVRTTYLPDDETCFHLVEATSEESVAELCRRAGLGNVRIVVAVET
jgi:hypothetical protein